MNSVKKDLSLIDYIKNRKKLIAICVPLTSDAQLLANSIRKRLNKGFNEIFYVSWMENNDNSSFITYDKIVEYKDKYSECLFITDSWQDTYIYFDELTENNNNNNYFITMFDSKTKKKKSEYDTKRIFEKIVFLWPNFAELDFEFIEIKKNVYLDRQQSENYLDLYNNFNKFSANDNFQNMKVSKKDLYGNLNIYYDNIVRDLTGTSLDIALKRSPKFKFIITDLLLENKQRHIVYMEDGKYGLDAFSFLYEKVKSKNNTIPYLVVIKKSDGQQEIKRKLINFNSTNIPTIIATDYVFKLPDIPKNVDSFKFANGGCEEYIDSIIDFANAKFYTGTYPRKFKITSYVSKTDNNLITLDDIEQENFTQKFNRLIYSNLACKKSTNIFVKGEDFYIQILKN